MQRFAKALHSRTDIFKQTLRHLRYLRPEFTGEYLPQVDDKHLEAHRTNKFTKYSQIDPPSQQQPSDGNTPPDAQLGRVYPELFPYLPLVHMRDSTRERIELREMMKRRKQLDIPEFYAGSIMAVTVADPFAVPHKTNRFVGICIYRFIRGLLSTVRLRNVIDNVGIEMEYELYNPTLTKIEVLKLERRLDDNLFYLRDALPEYSRVPLDTAQEPRPSGNEVPLNEVRVRMNPRPWNIDWHHHNYRGIDDSAWGNERDKPLKYVEDSRSQIGRYDLMKTYRERGALADRHEAMRQVEVLHHHIIDYHEQRYRQALAQMKADRDQH